jgi:hypothetical protein
MDYAYVMQPRDNRMSRSAKCEECFAIARELADAAAKMSDEQRRRWEAEDMTSQKFAKRLREMTDDDWLRLAESFEESRLGRARRRIREHNVLTGHWAMLAPFRSSPPD